MAATVPHQGWATRSTAHDLPRDYLQPRTAAPARSSTRGGQARPHGLTCLEPHNDYFHGWTRCSALLSCHAQQCTSECDAGDDDGGGPSEDDRSESDFAESGELDAGSKGEHRGSEKQGLRDVR